MSAQQRAAAAASAGPAAAGAAGAAIPVLMVGVRWERLGLPFCGFTFKPK